MKKYVTARVLTGTIEDLEKEFETASKGVAFAAELYISLKRQLLSDIKGVFTTEELDILLESNNILTPDLRLINKQMLLSSLERYSERTEVNIDTEIISHKIKKASAASIFYLQTELFRFWNEPGLYKNKDIFFNTFG